MHYYLKYYADFSWVCSFCTCSVDVSFVHEPCHAFCQVKNSGRFFLQGPNKTRLQWVCSVGNALLTFFF